MCGIAGLLSSDTWKKDPNLQWLDRLSDEFGKALTGEPDWPKVKGLLERLAEDFQEMMAFSTHFELVTNGQARIRMEALLGYLRELRALVADNLDSKGRCDELESIQERLDDYIWQIDFELLQNTERVLSLMPESLAGDGSCRGLHFLAWTAELVLESLDKLEVRGRDSAGVSIVVPLAPDADPVSGLSAEEKDLLQQRRNIEDVKSGQVLEHVTGNGALVYRFTYKVADLVGQLGDNGRVIRDAIRQDDLLWKLAANLESVNIIAHTRWASNGIINVYNCHPVDGAVTFSDLGESPAGWKKEDTFFVLNGDVDNYWDLVNTAVLGRGACIPQTITTDAKILPVLFALETKEGEPVEERFRKVIDLCQGSMAIVMQRPETAEKLFLAQKGSGQSLYIGYTKDTVLFASEVYGLAARCRSSYPMTSANSGGASVVLSARPAAAGEPAFAAQGAFLSGSETYELEPEAIEIYSRDVYLSGFPYYIEKEIHDAPNSVRKTLKGKYVTDASGSVKFHLNCFGNSEALKQRMLSAGPAAMKRVLVIGQGTASIAAMGVAYLLERVMQRAGITVESRKASELIGFSTDHELQDALLIAVSQSGTTTDTNRVVDLAKSHGAWVHSIVNRRNSPLVIKSDSYFYTSDGRDVEMAVASTKAYYSQICAGKVLAMWFAQVLGTLSDQEIYQEIAELETLPQQIEEVLAQKELIAEYAAADAPKRRYWAVVGNGPNRIAAEEIRIKLSELCYKSIPCDFTEDKKHIDLSTEPFTIVVANDLPKEVVQDTVKEVVIFKAHNGHPMVFCAQGETRFDPVADRVIRLPVVHGGLAFVVATVAGHLWGVEAAKAIDAQAAVFREIRSIVADAVVHGHQPEQLHKLDSAVNNGLQAIRDGYADSALPAGLACSFVDHAYRFKSVCDRSTPGDTDLPGFLEVVHAVVQEMTRTVDTIRHQAKTVTVGISRPQ